MILDREERFGNGGQRMGYKDYKTQDYEKRIAEKEYMNKDIGWWTLNER